MNNFTLLALFLLFFITLGLKAQKPEESDVQGAAQNANIPLGLNFGKAFAKNLSLFIGGEYVVSGPGKGDFTVRLNINAMFAPVN